MKTSNTRNLAKSLIATLLLLVLFNASAEPETDDPARPILGKTGQIFTLKFKPRSKQLTFNWVDKPMLTVGPGRIAVVARQMPMTGDFQTLKISPLGESFQIEDVLDPNSPIEIEVRDLLNNKSEVFKIDKSSLKANH